MSLERSASQQQAIWKAYCSSSWCFSRGAVLVKQRFSNFEKKGNLTIDFIPKFHCPSDNFPMISDSGWGVLGFCLDLQRAVNNQCYWCNCRFEMVLVNKGSRQRMTHSTNIRVHLSLRVQNSESRARFRWKDLGTTVVWWRQYRRWGRDSLLGHPNKSSQTSQFWNYASHQLLTT